MGATFTYSFDNRAIGKYQIMSKGKSEGKPKGILMGHQTKKLKVSRAETWNQVRIEN